MFIGSNQACHKHRPISHTNRYAAPEFGNLIFEKKKNNSKEIKINQKWSLEEDALNVHALFLQVSCTHQPAY